MADYVIVSHVLDEQAEVYRVTIGRPVIEDVPLSDAAGKPVTDADGIVQTEPRIVAHADVHDYVFSADDERWHAGGKRRPAKHVAAEQRDEVAAALRARSAKDAPATAGAELPGVGSDL